VSSFTGLYHCGGTPGSPGTSQSLMMGARQRHLRLARDSANSVCLWPHRYLYHAPTRTHTRPRTLTTPVHATAHHSHLLPANTPVPHSHLYFGYKLPVTGRALGPSQPSLRTKLPSTSTHALAKYTKPWLYPPPPLTKQRSSVGRVQTPHRLASPWCPFAIHSSNGLGWIIV